MGRPGTSRFLNCLPDLIERLKPPVGGGFIAHLPPDSLLEVQVGLIGRQVVEMKTPMFFHKLVHRISFMPAGPVDLQPQPITPQASKHLSQEQEKSLPIAAGGSDHPLASQQGGDPPGGVQPDAVLTAGGNAQSLSWLRPTPSQAGMQRESSFILEHHRLLGPQLAQFFFNAR